MQTILGAGGIIGNELALVLPEFTDTIKLVARNPEKVNQNDVLVSCDLLDETAVSEAVKGSDIVYLVAGLHYKASVWQTQWPRVMQNTLNACATHGAKLVFFDNIYMYDPSCIGEMDERTPVRPSSSKGKVRAQIADMVIQAHEAGKIEALIARSADFYGPGIRRNGVLRETVINNLATGKKANWFCTLDKVHSFTYTPDAARGTAMLGNASDTYGEVWHLPTAPNPMTGQEWVDAFAQGMNVKSRAQVAPKFLVKIMGLFMPIMNELVEMLYQYDRDYVFKSTKFEQRFDFKPTSYQDGINAIISQDFSQ